MLCPSALSLKGKYMSWMERGILSELTGEPIRWANYGSVNLSHRCAWRRSTGDVGDKTGPPRAAIQEAPFPLFLPALGLPGLQVYFFGFSHSERTFPSGSAKSAIKPHSSMECFGVTTFPPAFSIALSVPSLDS